MLQRQKFKQRCTGFSLPRNLPKLSLGETGAFPSQRDTISPAYPGSTPGLPPSWTRSGHSNLSDRVPQHHTYAYSHAKRFLFGVRCYSAVRYLLHKDNRTIIKKSRNEILRPPNPTQSPLIAVLRQSVKKKLIQKHL